MQTMNSKRKATHWFNKKIGVPFTLHISLFALSPYYNTWNENSVRWDDATIPKRGGNGNGGVHGKKIFILYFFWSNVLFLSFFKSCMRMRACAHHSHSPQFNKHWIANCEFRAPHSFTIYYTYSEYCLQNFFWWNIILKYF